MRTSSVVLPDPGLETKFSASTPCVAKNARFSARIGVILGQDVPFDADDPFLGHAGNMHACDPRAEIDEALAMPMLMRMVMMMLVRMIVMMGMIVMMIVMCAMGVAMPMRMGMVLAPGAFFLAGGLLRLH